jgi:hypothetical protein
VSALGPLLREVAAALSQTGAPFALVGGLAVSARTEPRFTRDVDVVLSRDERRPQDESELRREWQRMLDARSG